MIQWNKWIFHCSIFRTQWKWKCLYQNRTKSLRRWVMVLMQVVRIRMRCNNEYSLCIVQRSHTKLRCPLISHTQCTCRNHIMSRLRENTQVSFSCLIFIESNGNFLDWLPNFHSAQLTVFHEKKVPYEVKVPVDRPYKVEVEKPYPGIFCEKNQFYFAPTETVIPFFVFFVFRNFSSCESTRAEAILVSYFFSLFESKQKNKKKIA